LEAKRLFFWTGAIKIVQRDKKLEYQNLKTKRKGEIYVGEMRNSILREKRNSEEVWGASGIFKREGMRNCEIWLIGVSVL